MKIIIGLGNPGIQYSKTRHNAGYMVADNLSQIVKEKPGIPNKSQILVFKSPNFMNQSGDFVKKQVDKYQIKTEDLYIIHDDLDIPFGESKIQFGRGPKDHNGVASVDEALGTNQYWHVRVGIDNRSKVKGKRQEGEQYVLQNFADKEKQMLPEIIKSVSKKLVTIINNPISKKK
jgi:PTH1 family peptidyl-tRNA hydrolase